MMTLPTLRPRRRNPGLGFSIGGWDPFGGNVLQVLTGGTINGEGVSTSGGILGLYTNVDAATLGITKSILGTNSVVAQAVESVLSTIDSPISAASFMVNYDAGLIELVVGVIASFYLGPLAYAAWQYVVGSDAVEAAVDADEVVVDADAEAADQAAQQTMQASLGTPAPNATTNVILDSGTPLTAGPVDTGSTFSLTGQGTLATDDAPIVTATPATAPEPLPDLPETPTVPTTDLPQVSTTPPSSLPATAPAPVSTGSALGDQIANAVVKTAVGGLTSTIISGMVNPGQTVATVPTAPPSALKTVPSWAYLAAAALGILFLADS